MKISSSQIRKIYKLANDLALDDEVLHSFVWAIARKESIKELDMSEAREVIDYLSGKESERSERADLEIMTAKQRGMILYLASCLGWTFDSGKKVDLKRLDGYVRKEYSTINFFSLSRSKACKCIESMKAMLERLKKAN